MATISYSVSGEGRGHATRARVVIDALRTDHRIIVYCYGDSWDLLAPVCKAWDIEVREIPGLRFAYNSQGRLSRTASAARALPYMAGAPEWILRLARRMEGDMTDLALVDFEPLLPRSAQLAQIPSVALDHQQFLIACDLGSLPPRLQRQASLLAALSVPFYANPVSSIISSFFFPPLKPGARNVRQAGVLLRPEVKSATPTQGDYLVAYVRRHPPVRVMEALASLGHPVRVYGTNRTGCEGLLNFKCIDPLTFAEDLAGSQALLTTAGNQVVGEALSLGKPVLAYPEPGNVEQEINGHYLNESGAGLSIAAGQMTQGVVKKFLDSLETYTRRIEPAIMNGNSLTISAIEAALNRHPAPAWSQQPAGSPASAGLGA